MSKKNKQFHISRLLAVLLCVVLFAALTAPVYAAEGTCGDDLTWSFDGSTLTISGSGVMNDYTESEPAPWYEFREQISGISLPEGLTRIGTGAFAECTNLSSVNIPGGVQIIDDYAFLGCTGMTMLVLNAGIRTIGQCAFEQCKSLADVNLPNTLINLNNHAFYMCESLVYITIPSQVKVIGSGVFSYCSNLVRADINANATMPKWSFYGCDKLEIVTIQGSLVEPESLMIATAPQGVGSSAAVTPAEPEEPSVSVEPSNPEEPSETDNSQTNTGFVSSGNIVTDENGQQVLENTTVSKNEDATVTTTDRTPVGGNGSTTTTIDATIRNDKGWSDVTDKVNSATIGGNSETVDVKVYLPNSDTVPSEVLQQFAGKNVSLTIQTKDGSSFILDCTKLEASIKDDLTLNYTIAAVDEEDVPEELKGYTVYRLKFADTAQLPVELVIRLPGGHAHNTATLYQRKGIGNLEKLQSAVVDPYGDVHWYVSAVDHKTKYFIAVNVPIEEGEESPLIPKNLEEEYQVHTADDGKQYVITGRSSSWGMNLGQVMGILAGVMVGVIALVGVIMYLWNRSRVKEGMVPGLENLEDDEEDITLIQ